MAESTKRYAVVTGANKGIGFEICKQLASKGIIVILTARDEKRGQEAVKKLDEECGLSGHVVFHQLDVTDPASIASLADFVKTQYGKLDILVNNAGVAALADFDYLKAANKEKGGAQSHWSAAIDQPYQAAEECLNINYYGAKKMVEALMDLLHFSDSPRIVNVSSTLGKLERVSNEWAKGVLSDVENLSEEKLDEVVKVFLDDYKDGSLVSKSWAADGPAYTISKATMNAYTRILAKKYPNVHINSVCPGYCKTDLNFNSGILPAKEGAESPVNVALLPNGGPSGYFFDRKEKSSF